MFARSLLVFACVWIALAGPLRAADTTLPNGIRWVELPGGSPTRIVFGFSAGVRDEPPGAGGLAVTAARYWSNHPAARSLRLLAYQTGGTFELFAELDRSGIRLELQPWTAPAAVPAVSQLFGPSEAVDSARVEFARAAALDELISREPTFSDRVDDEIRNTLFGLHPYRNPENGSADSLRELVPETVDAFIAANYTTDRAYVVVSGPVPEGLRDALAAVPSRKSTRTTVPRTAIVPAERTIRFASPQDEGGVVLAAPVPSVYYRGWYETLVVDQLLKRALGARVRTSIRPALDGYFYRVQVSVPPGKLIEKAEDEFVQDIQRLQFVRPSPETLDDARRAALAALDRPATREWFASLGLTDRWTEGSHWIQSMTADDSRALARDLLVGNRVLATWSPATKTTVIQVESLNAVSATNHRESRPAALELADKVSPLPVPGHTHPERTAVLEQLSNGVTIVVGTDDVVFVSGVDGSNGAWRQTAEVFRERPAPNRILAFSSAANASRARTVWESYASPEHSTVIVPQGEITPTDLPAAFCLKLLMDRRLVEAGWSDDVTIAIDATAGAALDIRASLDRKSRVLDWIRAQAGQAPTESEMTWIREAAAHRLDTAWRDLQALLWQRDPGGIFRGLESVSAQHIQDVARFYFTGKHAPDRR